MLTPHKCDTAHNSFKTDISLKNFASFNRDHYHLIKQVLLFTSYFMIKHYPCIKNTSFFDYAEYCTSPVAKSSKTAIIVDFF